VEVRAMTREEKVRWLAKLVTDKHGNDAFSVAQGRAEECKRRGDHEAHIVWLEIQSALTRTGGKRSNMSLGDVLDGAVTQQVMRADDVSMEHVESVMQDAKKRRG
jgi:hypothetical protein